MSLQAPTLEVIHETLPTQVVFGGNQISPTPRTSTVSQDLRNRPVAAQCLQSGCPIAAFVVTARTSKLPSQL
jgi:hypothetical protein